METPATETVNPMTFMESGSDAVNESIKESTSFIPVVL